MARGEILRGERFFVERFSPWTDFSMERQPRRDNLQVENISVERLFEERRDLGRTQPALTYKLLRLVYICQLQCLFS